MGPKSLELIITYVRPADLGKTSVYLPQIIGTGTESDCYGATQRRKMMEQRSGRAIPIVAVLWTLILCCALPGPLFADDDDEDGLQLVGAWRVIGNAGRPGEFFSVMVFNRERTLNERSSDRPLSVSFGEWKKIPGHGNFAATFEGFWDADADGHFDRRFVVRATIQLVEKDELVGTATFDVFSLDGLTHLAGPLSGLTLEGARMTVILE